MPISPDYTKRRTNSEGRWIPHPPPSLAAGRRTSGPAVRPVAPGAGPALAGLRSPEVSVAGAEIGHGVGAAAPRNGGDPPRRAPSVPRIGHVDVRLGPATGLQRRVSLGTGLRLRLDVPARTATNDSTDSRPARGGRPGGGSRGRRLGPTLALRSLPIPKPDGEPPGLRATGLRTGSLQDNNASRRGTAPGATGRTTRRSRSCHDSTVEQDFEKGLPRGSRRILGSSAAAAGRSRDRPRRGSSSGPPP
jgi:hypothetical protein